MIRKFGVTVGILLFFFSFENTYTRNYHRLIDPNIGHINVRYADEKNEKNSYDLYESHLRYLPLFRTFNYEYFMQKQLPKDKINYLYETENFIKTDKLNSIIETLIDEINKKQQTYKNFKILKRKNFNYKKGSGLIVLKFKDYPFILKLYIETPKDFVDPHSFSFQEDGIFYMGGALRHTSGWTRIMNAENVKEKIKQDVRWNSRVVIPRKWFWLPKNPKWLLIKAYNLGDKKEQQVELPAIYGVICDEIKSIEDKSAYVKEFLELCNFVEFQIDPHPNNFKLDLQKKIALIDTEHYPTMTGHVKRLPSCNSHFEHYMNLANKYLKSRWGISKKERIEGQKNTKSYYQLFID